MPRAEPPYPSISSVLSSPSQPRNARSSRLPAYRASHMGRFHPYPRAAPGRCQDWLMSTVDYRYVEDPLWEETVGDTEHVAEHEEHASVDEEALPATAHREPSDDAALAGPEVGSQLGRSKLVATLSDALAALRRYLSRQALKSLLKPEQLKRA
ncbi:hypothetical protein BV20DRAFT_403133 [Pilatotrama ljubarskyi]|nr:hypothetical protein BV20DRAFT_403133 [Pilatotrama ljubarskyi]